MSQPPSGTGRAEFAPLPHVVGLGRVEGSLAGSAGPVRVVGTKVIAGLFDVMAVVPARGRAFGEADFRGDASEVNMMGIGALGAEMLADAILRAVREAAGDRTAPAARDRSQQ